MAQEPPDGLRYDGIWRTKPQTLNPPFDGASQKNPALVRYKVPGGFSSKVPGALTGTFYWVLPPT